jgi:predicted small lipoprotein YifL
MKLTALLIVSLFALTACGVDGAPTPPDQVTTQ